jgi:hypothetical protein
MKKSKAEKVGGETSKVRTYVALALVGVAVVLLVAWLASGDSDSSKSGSGEAEIVSVESLRDAVAGQGTPVYWAGEQKGAEVELSQPGEGRTYLRYLTGGAEAGDPRANFLTVGTYAHANPVAALQRQGQQPGGVVGTAPGHATVYFNQKQPHSVYLAYPGVDVEIEVYDPNFTRALQLVNSGQIVPAG